MKKYSEDRRELQMMSHLSARENYRACSIILRPTRDVTREKTPQDDSSVTTADAKMSAISFVTSDESVPR